MKKAITLKLSPGVSAELDNCLTNMAHSGANDPSSSKGKAALGALKTSGKRGAATLITDDVNVARTVLGELEWIAWQCDGYDASMRGMIGAARRYHKQLEALIKAMD